MPEKINLIFLHGAGVASQWWHPQFDALREDYHVFAPDLPGHGTMAETPFSTAASLHMIDQICKKLSGPIVLIGISMGGYIAIQYAYQNPGTVSGLVLSGCSMNLNGLAGFSFKITGLFLKLRGPAWLEEVQLTSFRKRIPEAMLEPVLAGGFYAKSAVSAFGKLSGKNYHHMLKHFSNPIMIVNGERDEPNRPYDKKLEDAIPQLNVTVLENAGHLCSLEQPEAYSAAVRRFANQFTVKRP